MNSTNKPDLGQFRIPESQLPEETSVHEAFIDAYQLANPNKEKTEKEFHKYLSEVIDTSEALVVERESFLLFDSKNRGPRSW